MPQLLVLAMPFSKIDQGSYQNQLEIPGSSGYYHPSLKPQLQISNQDAKQKCAAVGTGNAVFQDLDQTHSKAICFYYNGSKGLDRFYRFPSFIISKTDFFSWRGAFSL